MKKMMNISLTVAGGKTVEYTVEVDGLFMYKDNMSANDSIRHFVDDYHQSVLDFNACYGAYRFSLFSKEKSVFFADNSGMMRFYINSRDQKLYHSLAEAEKEKQDRVPNYFAIAQFLCYGCVYHNYETIVQSVLLSDPNMYYVIEQNKMIKCSKNLKPLAECKDPSFSLKRLLSQAMAHCEGNAGCTITGGTDSRAVLANLIDLNIKPELAITGNEFQDDVNIAREIAETSGLALSVISDSIEEEDWLEASAEAADGQEGICGIYRLSKLAKHLQRNNITLQFGGVAGEMYKNSFIIQDFPFYTGKPKWNRFYQYKVGTFDLSGSLAGEKIRQEIDRLPDVIVPWLAQHSGKNKAEAYLDAGYEIMQARCNLVINMFQRYTTSYNPLMERKMAAYAFGINPYQLEMQAFQRREVTTHCGMIKNICTDRKLTCNYKKRGLEFIASYLFLVKVAMQRLLFRNRIDIRVDPCFETGLHHPMYNEAIQNIKKLGILDQNVKPEDIQTGLADRLFTVGLFFGQA